MGRVLSGKVILIAGYVDQAAAVIADDPVKTGSLDVGLYAT